MDTTPSTPEPTRCTSLSEDDRRCHGDVGHPCTHWAGASRVWSDTKTLVRPVADLTLTAFLEARFTEDERGAEHLDPSLSRDGWLPKTINSERVLADVKAKRSIVDLHSSWGYVDTGSYADSVLRHLASVYAEHPDYRAEWSL